MYIFTTDRWISRGGYTMYIFTDSWISRGGYIMYIFTDIQGRLYNVYIY